MLMNDDYDEDDDDDYDDVDDDDDVIAASTECFIKQCERRFISEAKCTQASRVDTLVYNCTTNHDELTRNNAAALECCEADLILGQVHTSRICLQ